MDTSRPPSGPALSRTLGAWDGTLITVGSVVGTGIFLVGSDIARALPNAGMILALWLAGGVLSLAGALTYAELGTMYPRAGGIYHFLREAFGPLAGFLYGWACFLVIMSGGIAAIAVGTARYFAYFVPFSAPDNIVWSVGIGSWTWTLSGSQIVAALLILGLTLINHFGVRGGAFTQNLLTLVKIVAIGGFVLFGLLAPARASNPLTGGALGGGVGWAGLGVAMIAVLWTYDGWYGLTFSAGEMRRPERDLPLGLIGGTALVTALYLLLNWIYLRALPVAAMADEPRLAEVAASALFGPSGGRAMAMLVTLSSLGCVAATLLYSSRIYQPMADDGVFFRSLAAIHPRHHVPTRSLWAQSLWAVVLTISGTYDQIYTYVVFVAVLFHVAACSAVFVLRRREPDRPRPYRVWGYPWVPIAFLAASLLLVASTLRERPVESIAGLGILAIGLPAYWRWRRRAKPAGVARVGATLVLAAATAASASAAPSPAGAVEIVAPRSGQVVVAGSSFDIAWRSLDNEVEFEEWEAFLSLDAGRSWPFRLTPHLDGARRSVRVELPAVPSDRARLLLRFGDERDERPPVAESELGESQYYRLPARSWRATWVWRFESGR